MGLVFWEYFALAIGPVPALWKWAGAFCAIVIVLAIPVQLGTFIRRKIKTRVRPT
jgi:hypothetical protein